MAGPKTTCFLIPGLMNAVWLQTSHLIPQFPKLCNEKNEERECMRKSFDL